MTPLTRIFIKNRIIKTLMSFVLIVATNIAGLAGLVFSTCGSSKLPLAAISGAVYDDVEIILGRNVDFESGSIFLASAILLRDFLGKVQAAIYRHYPLVAILDVKNCNNKSCLFEYDDFYKPRFSKVFKGNILEKICCNYKLSSRGLSDF